MKRRILLGKNVHKLIAQATCNERAKIWFGCPGWEPPGRRNWKKSRKRLVHFCQRLMSKTTTLEWPVRDSGTKFFWRSLLGVSDAHLHGVTKSGIGAARKLLQSVLQTKRGTRRIPENQIEGPVGSQPGWRPLNGRIFFAMYSVKYSSALTAEYVSGFHSTIAGATVSFASDSIVCSRSGSRPQASPGLSQRPATWKTAPGAPLIQLLLSFEAWPRRLVEMAVLAHSCEKNH